MATVYPANQWQDGDTLQPDQPNVELQILAGEMNGHLDRDNIASGSLSSAKFAVDTFHVIGFAEVTVAIALNSPTNYTSIAAFDLQCDDGFVEVNGQATYGVGEVLLKVLVDGHVVAHSFTRAPDSFYNSGAAANVFPVGAGLHRIELRMYYGTAGTLFRANLYARSIRR